MHALHEYELTKTGVRRVCPGWLFKGVALSLIGCSMLLVAGVVFTFWLAVNTLYHWLVWG